MQYYPLAEKVIGFVEGWHIFTKMLTDVHYIYNSTVFLANQQFRIDVP